MRGGEHMTLKTKFFLGGNINRLEKEINEFLSKINPNNLVDVKYEMTDIGTSSIHNISYSAMIIYKED